MQIPKFPKMPDMPALAHLKNRIEGDPRLAQGVAVIKSNPTRARRALMIGSTFLIAIGAGQFMQSSGAPMPDAPPIVQAAMVPALAETPAVQPAEAVRAGEAVAALPSAPSPVNITEVKDHGAYLLPDEPMVAGIDVVSFEPVTGEAALTPAARPAYCDAPELRLTEQPNGIVAVSFHAPCLTNTEVSINQLGAKFKVVTDFDGRYSGSMPALTQTPVVEVHLPEGQTVTARIILAETVNGERIALAWEGSKDLALNAFEYGAEFGGAGHVWAQSSRLPGNSVGGYLVRLGDPDLTHAVMTDIYVAPAGMTDVKFDIEALVTQATCNRDLSASILRVTGAETVLAETLTIAMPECDAVGDAIIMPLREQDLQLAMMR